jgi:peptidoglycan hydrolase-like protein with peptidoglycan-binding domain
MRRRHLAGSCVVVVAVVLLAAAEGAAGRPAVLRARAEVAGVQVALRTLGRYHGAIDGVAGPLTKRAIRSLQHAGGLPPGGQIGAATRKLLGPFGRPMPGSRVLRQSMVGLDVSALQFELRQHGYAVPASGFFGAATRRALIAFQRSAGIGADGLAGAATWAALEHPTRHAQADQVVLRPPLAVKAHAVVTRSGLELFCPYGSAVAAAGAGSVTYVGNRGRGYGYTVITRDGGGLQVVYAHLARIDVHRGQRLIAGAMIGLAGWTGKPAATASLLLQLSDNGRPLNPLRALQLDASTP